MQLFFLALALLAGTLSNAQKFPEHFLFGTASSAYQIEGAWNTEGKGESIWDAFAHNMSARIADRSSGDVSADAYHRLEDDVLLLKKLGVDFYTFSLSWSRILPNGFAHDINPAGVHYYSTLINLLIKHEIAPVVALFHWDTPQHIETLGGFTNALIVDWFEEYAKVAFENYGNRVKTWLTFNDPKDMCLRGYGGANAAPGYNSSGIADYMCAHNVLKAHARVYHLYNSIYRPLYKGKISIGLGSNWYEPASTSPEDIQAAKRAVEFSLAWFADPIFHPLGLYPKAMHKEIESRSEAEGFASSRLPAFHKDEVKYIRGTHDFFAVNHYDTEIVSNANGEPIGKPGYVKDCRVRFSEIVDWTNSSSKYFKDESTGLQKLLNYIKYRYQNPQIFVTGNGFADGGGKDDQQRIKYLEKHLKSVLAAIETDEVNVAGYAAWSFLDGFEWEDGYTIKYGLHHVDFTSPNRTRSPKSSAKYYKDIVANKRLIISEKSRSSKSTRCFVLEIIVLIVVVLNL